MFSLEGKTILVTGGNSGLGCGVAKAIAELGGKLVIWGRRDEKNQQAAEILRSRGAEVVAQAVDVADSKQVADAFVEAVEQAGDIHGVVANAGIAPPEMRLTHEHDDEYFSHIAGINQLGVFHTLREAAKHMITRSEAGRPGGSLVGMSSLSGFLGYPGLAAYASAKGAMEALIRVMVVEYGAYGIRANCVAPGYTLTEMGDADSELQGNYEADAMSARVPLGRVGQSNDVSGAVIYLLSDAAEFHTGDSLVIDGGISINGL